MKLFLQIRRRGVAAIWALVVLSVVSGLGLCVVARVSLARKDQDRELAQDQAEWLSRSGLELAIDRLQTKKAGYKGETASPVPGSEVKIKVSPTGQKEAYLIECDVRYKVETRGITVTRLARFTVKLDGNGKVDVLREK